MRHQQETFQSGDINLVSALMTVGVPPARRPKLVLTDNGESYARFHLGLESIDGIRSHQLSLQWANPFNPTFKVSDPFEWVMRFITEARKANAKANDDLFDYAFVFLADHNESTPFMPSKIAKIADFVRSNPDNVAGHIFAYVANRVIALDEVKAARRQIMIHRGENHAIIDTHLNPALRNEILARVEG